MRIPPALLVGPEDVEVLRSWIATGEAGAAAARRARIVLLAADGLGPAAIAERLGCSKQTAITWRERFRADGLEGLRDAPRSGRPVTVDEAVVVARTLEAPPGARWSTRLLAAELGISNAAVGGVWRARGILPGPGGGVRFSTEPVLDAALHAVVGVHVGPVERVLALMVGGPGEARPEVTVPVRERPDVAGRLADTRAGPGDGSCDLAGFLKRLAAAAPVRLALLAEPGGGQLREWVAARPGVALHVVPAGLAWAGLASVMCTVAGATARGAASVAALARVLDARPQGGPVSWTA